MLDSTPATFLSPADAGLFEAVNDGSPGSVRAAVEAGADVFALDLIGQNPLERAAGDLHGASVVAELLSSGAHPDGPRGGLRPGARASTPLMKAACANIGAGSMRALIDFGADLDVADEAGRTALTIAVHAREMDKVGMLLAAGANLAWPQEPGCDAAMAAVKVGEPRMFRMLLEAGADAGQATSGGITLGILAARLGHPECLEAMADRQVDWSILGGDGLNALDWAIRSQGERCAGLVRKMMAEQERLRIQEATPRAGAPAAPAKLRI